MKKTILAFALLVIWAFPFKFVFADNNFKSSYETTYLINEQGVADVTEKITLTNLTDTSYATNFTLSISSTTVHEVIATDEGGNMETKVENNNNKTIINSKFNNEVTGAGKSQTFFIKFKSKDFTNRIGKIWEVNLPKIPNSPEIENFTVKLIVPISFGDPTSISPKPASDTQNLSSQIFIFNQDQLKKSAVSVNFGTTQIYNFDLKYELENKNLIPLNYSVTLPPDTNYQSISIFNIEPKPFNVTIDVDGNYLAWYFITPNSKKEISVKGQAKLFIYPQKGNELTTQNFNNFLKSDKYWEVDNPLIKSALAEIFKKGTPQKTADKAKLIYDYVVNNLTYDSSRVKGNLDRLGAVTALNNPKSAICMEFTDLFIALSRAAGIPARELDGYAYSQNNLLRPTINNENILHAWAEYFDPNKGWIMVDPTWENTSGGIDYFNKFDLDHLVLGIKGNSSVYPPITDKVNITINDDDFIAKENYDIQIISDDIIHSPIPANAEIKIINSGTQKIDPANIKIELLGLTADSDLISKIESIPAFGFQNYKLKLKTPFTWQEKTAEISVTYKNKTVTKKIIIKPLISFVPVQYLFIFFVLLLVLVYGVILYLHHFKKVTKIHDK